MDTLKYKRLGHAVVDQHRYDHKNHDVVVVVDREIVSMMRNKRL